MSAEIVRTVVVDCFRNRKRRFRVQILGGVDIHSTEIDESSTDGASVGLGDVKKSVFGVRALGVALCVVENSILLIVGTDVFDLLDPALSVRRQTIGPFLKRFVVLRRDEVKFRCTYVGVDVFDDPMNGTRDILQFASQLAASVPQKLRFFHVWKALQRGDDITSERIKSSIDEAVRSRSVV